MISLIAETDDTLGEKYLMGEEITEDELRAGLAPRDDWQQTRPCTVRQRAQEQRRAVGARCGRGLSAVAGRYPAGHWRNPRTANRKCAKPSENESLSALGIQNCHRSLCRSSRIYSCIFRQIDDRHRRSSTSTKNQRERIGRLLRMHANNREEIDEICAGDIAAVVGPKNTFTGDTLCDPGKPDHS